MDKLSLKHNICQVCGTDIPAGGVFYTARTEIVSGSDGTLPDTDVSGDAIIEEALQEISRYKSDQEFMDEVYQEIKLILCGQCRLKFRDTILDMIRF